MREERNMNNDLISREALKKALHNFFDGKVIDEPAYILRDVFCHIDGAPTVELDESVIQEVLNKRCMTAVTNEYLIALHGKGPQGEWIEGYHDGFTTHDCSVCGYSKEGTHLQYNFCPNCGARMKGD